MERELTLCRGYLYDDGEFWAEALRVRDRLRRDPVMEAYRAALERVLCREQNWRKADELYPDIRAYVELFHPGAADLLAGVLLGGMAPFVVRRMREQKVEEAVIRDTLGDFGLWARHFEKREGRKGLANAHWVMGSFSGDLVRLGRLQYEQKRCDLPYYIYRHGRTGEYRALSRPGRSFDGDGYPTGAGGRSKPEALVTELKKEGSILTGYAADLERGVLLPRRASIPLEEWEPVLVPGQGCLGIHIPGDGGLLPEEVEDSLKRAKAFFAGRGYAAAICESWLLDVHLERFCLPKSNVVRFMRRFHKLPVEAPVPMIYERVMGPGFDRKEAAAFPAATGMQRALRDYLLSGGRVMDMAGFLALD